MDYLPFIDLPERDGRHGAVSFATFTGEDEGRQATSNDIDKSSLPY
jgi:hypothetical protein